MKLRPFGDTGINVSEIGLGAWQLANPEWGSNDKNEALRIVQKSLEAGCNFFDTAPGYGGGRSEELLGQGLKSVRKDVILCTKFSYYNENHQTEWKAEHVRPVLEGSFKRLQTDYVDILLLHNPPRELMDGNTSAELYGELEMLKEEGKISRVRCFAGLARRVGKCTGDNQKQGRGSFLQCAVSGSIARFFKGAGTRHGPDRQSAFGFRLALGALSRQTKIRGCAQSLVSRSVGTPK